MIVIQLFSSLFRKIDCNGEAQRYLGNNDPWTLIGQKTGILRIDSGKIFPYDITTKKSGFFGGGSKSNSGS